MAEPIGAFNALMCLRNMQRRNTVSSIPQTHLSMGLWQRTSYLALVSCGTLLAHSASPHGCERALFTGHLNVSRTENPTFPEDDEGEGRRKGSSTRTHSFHLRSGLLPGQVLHFIPVSFPWQGPDYIRCWIWTTGNQGTRGLLWPLGICLLVVSHRGVGVGLTFSLLTGWRGLRSTSLSPAPESPGSLPVPEGQSLSQGKARRLSLSGAW